MKTNHILIVEDDKEIREGIEIYLKSQGYQVYQATDGVEGLEVIDQEEIHLAIVDIMMPRMDGITMTAKLREKYDAPKYRRKVAYGKIKQDIADILSMLCKRKGVKIIEAEICPDHVHMLVEIPPSISVSYFVGYLKGKSTLMIFERHANLKYKYGNRHFWCRGYYVDTVGKNAKKIQEYIANQLQDDLEYDQMTLKEYIDSFTGEPVKTSK